MNTISNFFMQMLMMLFLQNLCNSGTENTTSDTATQETECSTDETTAQTTESDTQTTDETTAETSCETTVQSEEQTKKDIVNLTTDNLESDLRKQKGTSYVVACIGGCQTCFDFEPVLKSVHSSLGSEATFYNINPIYNEDTYMNLKKESGADTTKSYGYPIIIKCVDGVAKEFYSYDDIQNIYTDEEKMTEWFKEKM